MKRLIMHNGSVYDVNCGYRTLNTRMADLCHAMGALFWSNFWRITMYQFFLNRVDVPYCNGENLLELAWGPWEEPKVR